MKSISLDAISHKDSNGEYWLARELMPVVGATNWISFRYAIETSAQILQNTESAPEKHLTKIVAPNPNSKDGRNYLDFRLSAYAAYLAVLNLNPWDENVAKAQLYFTTKIFSPKQKTGGINE